MESWLAARLDHLATLEAAGLEQPLTFTNWITTDPLEHPAEPFVDEDRVSVDATHLQATARGPAASSPPTTPTRTTPTSCAWSPLPRGAAAPTPPTCSSSRRTTATKP